MLILYHYLDGFLNIQKNFLATVLVAEVASLFLLQNLSSNSMKAEQPVLEKSTSQVEVVVDSEELKQMCQRRWSARCSLSSDIERTLLADSIGKSVDLSSVQYVNSLLYLTSSGSHSSNSNSDGDEIVDLTEPRLESFSIGNDH